MEGSSLTSTGSSVSSTGRRSLQTLSQPDKALTVETTSKIDIEDLFDDEKHFRPSMFIIWNKRISTFLIGGLLLAFVTQSKISMVALAEGLYPNRTGSRKVTCDSATSGEGRSQGRQVMVFSAILVLLLIPHVVNFLRGIWKAGLRKDIPWPRKKAFVVGFGFCFIESLGLCLFGLKVPSLMKPQFVPLVMNWVFFGPIVWNVVSCLRHGRREAFKLAVFAFALLLEIAGIVASLLALIKDNYLTKDVWVVPAAVLCLSISWVPEVQAYLLSVETEEVAQDAPEPDSSQNFSYGNYNGVSHSTASSGYDSETQHHNTHVQNTSQPGGSSQVMQTTRPTWKLTIYMSFVKIILTFIFSMVIYYWLLFDFDSFDSAMKCFGKSWNFGDLLEDETYFMIANAISSFAGYIFGYMACTTCMQKFGFAIPLFLATPLAVVLLSVNGSCVWIFKTPVCNTDQGLYLGVASACLVIAQILSTGWWVFKSQVAVMQKEYQIFWVPMFNNVLLEQWLLLARRNEHSDDQYVDPSEKAKRSKVIICTTMYRESKNEMKQLLQSIFRINLAQSKGKRHFESHVFFDGAVKDRNPTEFVLQLVSLVGTTLGVKPEECCKTQTPYGMSLGWNLPGERGMLFKIHLKDNFKVKNKKRWSQIMYMSYVLDFLMYRFDDATDEETYLLTTDADVRFTPDNVEALLDLMTRDKSVGAACARTYPLGSGPMVWYQVFEYAIGHWFQKAAEHVVGSVLCSPGCFSVYRCKALREIVPKYATNVEHAFDFLTKDMGEDRWLCTLMVQSGWRIEYCAASENSTFCPEEFEEFYKQRRRWVASTLANIMLLIKEWNIVAKFNHRVSIVFLIYQAILLFATLIGPSSVMLVVSGGLVYGWDINGVTSLVLQSIACIGFALMCLYTSSKTQMNAAKLLTFVYAVTMIAVVVGTAVQIAEDFAKSPEKYEKNGNTTELVTTTMRPSVINEDFPYSTTTLYLALLTALFLVTGLLHLQEVFFLMHGVWYLLCLPSGYLILMIYSVCNITDRSWGTREEQTKSVVTSSTSWRDKFEKYFREFFFCCFKDDKSSSQTPTEPVAVDQRPRPSRSESMVDSDNHPFPSLAPGMTMNARQVSMVPDDFQASVRLSSIEERYNSIADLPDADGNGEDDELDEMEVRDVKKWLPKEMESYVENFRRNGYENTMLISGMTEKELKEIGIKRRGLRKFLVEEIKLLPDYEIQAEVPDNVDVWLDKIGLPDYKRHFRKEHIKTSKDMEILKAFGKDEIEKELKITKMGHVKRLLTAISKLRNPTPDERKILETKRLLEIATVHDLKKATPEEFEFWEKLQKCCLFPSSKAFGSEEELKVKLGDLRNSWLMIMAVSNVLWLILITTLANKGQLLQVAGSNPVGLIVMVLFSFVLLIQFLAMLVHRFETLLHFLGRAPYRHGEAYNSSWTFSDKSIVSDDDHVAAQTVAKARKDAHERLVTRHKPSKKLRLQTTPPREENFPLLGKHESV